MPTAPEWGGKKPEGEGKKGGLANSAQKRLIRQFPPFISEAKW